MKINQSHHTSSAVELIGRDGNTVLNQVNTIRRVRQRKGSDCGVSCVAMVAGVSYQKAFNAFGFMKGQKTFYTSHKKLEEALSKLGCEVQRRRFVSWDDISGCAILPVNHRCKRLNFHWIVFNGTDVLDPNPKRPSRQKYFVRYRASGNYVLVTKPRSDVSTLSEGVRT